MPLTRGQILAELDRRGQLPDEFKSELAGIRQNGDKEFLAGLPPARAATAQAMAEGRMAVPNGMALRSAVGQQMISDLAQAYPNFNAADAKSQGAMRVSATSGKIGQNLASFNTALGHLGNLAESAEDLHNRSFRPYNQIGNFINTEFGGDAVRKFNIDRQAASDELTRAFRQAGGNVHDIKGWEENLNSADSPAQLRASIAEGAKLLQSRIDAIGEQYSQGMGTARDGLSLLNPHAQQAMRAFTSDQYRDHGYHAALAANPVGGNGDTGSGSMPGGNPEGGDPNSGGGGDPVTLATGQNRTESDPALAGVNDHVRKLLKSNASPDLIRGYLSGKGIDPSTIPNFDALMTFRAKNPGYKGDYTVDVDKRQVPNSLATRIASSPIGAGVIGAADAVTLGNLDELTGDPTGARQKMQALSNAHPYATLAGNAIGGLAAAGGIDYGLGKAAYALGDSALAGGLATGGQRAAYTAGRALSNPITSDLAFGAGYGAGSSDDDRLIGAALGGAGGVAGGMFGRGVARGFRSLRAPKVDAAGDVSGQLLATANKVGITGVKDQLGEAARMGVPMTLADTARPFSTLAGASVRRSPDAAQLAEDILLPRSRAQIDRLGASVNRNLGPTANIPQTAADLTAQARTTAAPLYDAAYNAPGASSVNLSDLSNRPSMKAGLNRAYSIAQEEGRDPTALGFDLSDHGEVQLTRVPSFHTLDYVKRGLDDTLEPHRDPITGKLALNETTSAINNTKNALLSRMDKVNPNYAAARKAYAGPVQARDALARGQDAFSLSPDELRMQVAGQTPEHLSQMQLGFRSQLMNRANSVRDASNPFDATLGNATARDRISALYPNNPGNANLFRQQELEKGLARTQNDILGNSKTAERVIADQAFAGGAVPALAADAGMLALGGVPVASIARHMTGKGVSDAFTLGLGKRAVAKADALTPALLDTNPQRNIDLLTNLAAQDDARRAYIDNPAVRRLSGMFGRGIGTAGIGYLGGF